MFVSGSALPIALAGLALLAAAVAWLIFFYDNGHSGFDWQPARPSDPVERPEGRRETVFFPALDDTRLEGWLYLPTTRAETPPPLVIMAPGLTGTKEGHLEPFAWRFVAEGLAVLLFDFRTSGGSDGLPRHWIDPFRQRDDYRAAIRHARDVLARDGRIDAERIALWGSSFSAGTAIVVAADDPSIRAVVAQCPYLETAPSQQPSRLEMIRYVAWTTLDLVRAGLRARFGLALAPVYLPAFGKPGEFAFARSRENPSRTNPADRGAVFWQTLPRALRGGWENKLLARFLADFDRWRPIDRVADVRCPLYFVVAHFDDMVPRETVVAAHARAANERSKLSTHDCGHFDLYLDPIRAKNATLQAEFLSRRLGAAAKGRAT